MALVFDRRVDLSGPVLHAIAIGVGDYAHLPAARDGDPGDDPGAPGLHGRTSASRTAIELARWLAQHCDDLVAPVATIRLCVAPAAGDGARPPRGATGATRAEIVAALHAWRAEQFPDDVALFYFAGHGVQRSRADLALLCSDFGAPGGDPLDGAIDLMNVWDGLGRIATTATNARTQLYFVDACRAPRSSLVEPARAGVPRVFDARVLHGKEDRRAPIFYATTPPSLAQASPGISSLFSRLLVRCLENDAATLDDTTGQWQITSKSLERALATRFRSLAGATTDHECDAEHAMHDFLISRVAAPRCDVRVHLDPDDAAPVAALRVRDLDRQEDIAVHRTGPGDPFDCSLTGGYYAFGAEIEPPTPPFVGCPPRPRLIDPSRLAPITLKVVP